MVCGCIFINPIEKVLRPADVKSDLLLTDFCRVDFNHYPCCSMIIRFLAQIGNVAYGKIFKLAVLNHTVNMHIGGRTGVGDGFFHGVATRETAGKVGDGYAVCRMFIFVQGGRDKQLISFNYVVRVWFYGRVR